MPTELATLSNPTTAERALNARLSWMKSLDDEADSSTGLRPSGAQRHFAQGREIYGEGENAGVFFTIVSGVVRTCKFLSDGRRQIDAFYVAGDIFGFEVGTQHVLSAEAVSDCTVIPYRRHDTDASKDDIMPRQLFSHAMRSLAQAQEHSLLLGRKSAVERVAAFLLEWVSKTAAGHAVNPAINLAMTRQDIADYLGLTLETVSRTLSQFERNKLIEIQTARQIWVKNMSALQNLNA